MFSINNNFDDIYESDDSLNLDDLYNELIKNNVKGGTINNDNTLNSIISHNNEFKDTINSTTLDLDDIYKNLIKNNVKGGTINNENNIDHTTLNLDTILDNVIINNQECIQGCANIDIVNDDKINSIFDSFKKENMDIKTIENNLNIISQCGGGNEYLKITKKDYDNIINELKNNHKLNYKMNLCKTIFYKNKDLLGDILFSNIKQDGGGPNKKISKKQSKKKSTKKKITKKNSKKQSIFITKNPSKKGSKKQSIFITKNPSKKGSKKQTKNKKYIIKKKSNLRVLRF